MVPRRNDDKDQRHRDDQELQQQRFCCQIAAAANGNEAAAASHTLSAWHADPRCRQRRARGGESDGGVRGEGPLGPVMQQPQSGAEQDQTDNRDGGVRLIDIEHHGP